MNREVLESSPVQHLTASGNPNWLNKVSSGFMPPPPPPSNTTYLLPSLFPNYFPSSSMHPTSNPNFFSSWLDQPCSHSQLLLGGLMMGGEERMEMMNHHHHQNEQHSYQVKTLENWEEQVLRHQAFIKQEININNGYMIMSSLNSPINKSCDTTTTTTLQNLNDDNNKNNCNGLNFYECDSSEISGSYFANKKAKLQIPSLRPSSQSTLKTDTASVLSEAIGYIRFLHSQIEVLNVQYFDTPSKNNMMHQHARGDMNGLFPQDPGQLVKEYCMKRSKGASLSTTNQSNLNEETTKDLKSKGLCLVPISCILQVADYWPPAFGITFQ